MRRLVLAVLGGLLVSGASLAQDGDVPLFRLTQGRSGDRLLTSDCGERHDVALRRGYADEGVIGYVKRGETAGMVPLNRFFYGRSTRHFYTTDRREGESQRYKFETVLGYVGSAPGPGLIPLVRLFDRRTGDHFYTSSEREAARVQAPGRYTVEGVVGYVQDRHDDPCPIR